MLPHLVFLYVNTIKTWAKWTIYISKLHKFEKWNYIFNNLAEVTLQKTHPLSKACSNKSVTHKIIMMSINRMSGPLCCLHTQPTCIRDLSVRQKLKWHILAFASRLSQSPLGISRLLLHYVNPNQILDCHNVHIIFDYTTLTRLPTAPSQAVRIYCAVLASRISDLFVLPWTRARCHHTYIFRRGHKWLSIYIRDMILNNKSQSRRRL